MNSCREEILAVARSLRERGTIDFTATDIVTELRQKGSSYEESTIKTHVTSRMCANAPNHHGTTYSDLIRVGRGLYRLN